MRSPEIERKGKEIIEKGFTKIYENIDLTKFCDDIDTSATVRIINWTMLGFAEEQSPVPARRTRRRRSRPGSSVKTGPAAAEPCSGLSTRQRIDRRQRAEPVPGGTRFDLPRCLDFASENDRGRRRAADDGRRSAHARSGRRHQFAARISVAVPPVRSRHLAGGSPQAGGRVLRTRTAASRHDRSFAPALSYVDYNRGWADGFRYGIEHWKIWNEPENGDSGVMWSGTAQQYYDLYRVAATAIKSFDPSLKVGGYAACVFGTDYMPGFMAFCWEHALPLGPGQSAVLISNIGDEDRRIAIRLEGLSADAAAFCKIYKLDGQRTLESDANCSRVADGRLVLETADRCFFRRS